MEYSELTGSHEQRLVRAIEVAKDCLYEHQARVIARSGNTDRYIWMRKNKCQPAIARHLQLKAVINQLERSLERHQSGIRQWEKSNVIQE